MHIAPLYTGAYIAPYSAAYIGAYRIDHIGPLHISAGYLELGYRTLRLRLRFFLFFHVFVVVYAGTF